MRWTFVSVSTIALTSLVTFSAHAQLRATGHYVVPQIEITNAIAKAFSQSVVTPQVALLSNVMATESSPLLDVTAISPLPQQKSSAADQKQLAVRLACHVSIVCLPFYVVTTWPSDAMPGELWQRPRESSMVGQTALQKSKTVMRSGAHATLILEEGSTQIEVAVISLESGSIGQNIRVASLDHKHVYTAHAVTATLLKGSF